MIKTAMLITGAVSWLRKHNPVLIMKQQATQAYNREIKSKVTLLPPEPVERCAYSGKVIQPGDCIIKDNKGRKYLLAEINKPKKVK